MADPMTPDQMLAAFKAEGIKVREYPGWKTRCRCCPDNVNHRLNGPYIRNWGDVNGMVQHITGGGLGSRTVEEYIRDIILFDKSLLTKSQFVTAPNGELWLVAAGRCNHTGLVGSKVRDHLRVADFSLTDDYDNRFQGASADGNGFTYGNEAIAASAMNASQRATSILLWAAIARFHKWTGQETVGHGEISSARGKGDPNLHMGQFRKDIMARVKAGTGTKPITPKPPVTPPAPKPLVQKATVLTLNVASENAVVNKKYGDWTKKRAAKAAKSIIASGADYVVLQEAYDGKRQVLDKLLKGRYVLDGVRRGRVIYRKVGLDIARVGGVKFTDLLPGKGYKDAVARKYRYPSGAVLNLGNAHLSYELTGTGAKNRAVEAKNFIWWMREEFPTGYDFYVGDVNAPYKGTTRTDNVGPVFAAYGLHDVGNDVNAKSGPGHYHLDRGFAGLIKATKIKVTSNDFTDHPGVLFTLAIPTK